MVELRGDKVVLRTLEREHCRVLWEAYEPAEPRGVSRSAQALRPHSAPTEPLNVGLSVEGADPWFEDMQAKQGKEQVYLGVFTHDGRLVGDIQLSNIDWRHRTSGIGLGIARRADRGQGFGLDATRTMLRYGFQHLDLHRVSAVTAEHNVAAIKILERCGFVQEGCEREAIFCIGRRWDRLRYGLLRAEFEEG
jgi:RimJ/RimL family protein N-acetyltransferase